MATSKPSGVHHWLVLLHTFVATLVPQLLVVHGHNTRDIVLAAIPAAAVTALFALFPGLKNPVKEVLDSADKAANK